MTEHAPHYHEIGLALLEVVMAVRQRYLVNPDEPISPPPEKRFSPEHIAETICIQARSLRSPHVQGLGVPSPEQIDRADVFLHNRLLEEIESLKKLIKSNKNC